MPTALNVTCLGCGCACDDIEIVSDSDRIVEARRACGLGIAWFGDGRAPARTLVDGRDTGLDEALAHTAGLLLESARPLVFLAPDLSCEAQRSGVAIADALGARLDSVTSATVMRSVLAQQERGRAGATLGEVRNRADTVVFWGVDPSVRYPRYWSRYAPEPVGVHVPGGRRSRTVVAVDVGASRGPSDADVRVAIAPDHEVAALTLVRAALTGAGRPADPGSGPGDEPLRGLTPELADVATLLTRGRYVAIVVDAEPDEGMSAHDPGRAEALIALVQALNGPTRAALSLLRAGGNRSGADAVMTWQTGYPAAVDLAGGYPEYRPHGPAPSLAGGDVDAVLVLGAASALPADLLVALGRHPSALIGPRASESTIPAPRVAVDTATAGIHESGTAFRMDDVPLPLRASIPGPPSAASVIARLAGRVTTAHGASR